MFFVTYLYAFGFVGNIVVRKSLDSGRVDRWPTALAVDLALLSLFAIQHSVMARQGFKRLLTRLIPRSSREAHMSSPLYRIVRHPLYVGWLFAFWCTPTMTIAHLLVAVMTTGYILVAIQLEERDLVRAHPEYGEYRRHVPMLIPGARHRYSVARAALWIVVLMSSVVFAELHWAAGLAVIGLGAVGTTTLHG